MKSILVTGAAQGFGRAIAESFAEAGWTVGAYDLDGDKVRGWAQHPNTIPGTLDVTDPDQWSATVTDFAARAGGINALINNAGVLYGGDFIDRGSFQQDSALVDVNVKGVIYGCRAAFEHLKAAGDGVVVNVCSASSIYGTPDMATYSATKFAVRGISEALDFEWDKHNIRVRTVLPLYSRTALIADVETAGMRRLGASTTPQDVAAEVVRAVTAPRRSPTKVHFPVGWKTKLLEATSHFSPPFLTRFVNGLLVYGDKVRL